MCSYCVIAVRERVTEHQAHCYTCSCFQLVFMFFMYCCDNIRVGKWYFIPRLMFLHVVVLLKHSLLCTGTLLRL
jgi:hypothetical protein